MDFRFATIADIDMLVSTRIEVLRAANSLDESVDLSAVERESRAYYKRALENDAHVAVLVYSNGHFAGAGGVSFYEVMPTVHNPSGRKSYIMNMYTRPECRRQGVAWHTLDMLVEVCRQRGVNCISLEATDMGRPLYVKYGFVAMNCEMELPA